jgi:hypothetical protein
MHTLLQIFQIMKTKLLVLFLFWKNKQMNNYFDNKMMDGIFTLLLLWDCGFFCWKSGILFMCCTGRNYISSLVKFLICPPKDSCYTVKLCENLEQISFLTAWHWKFGYHFGTHFAHNNTSHTLSHFVDKDCTGYICYNLKVWPLK